MPIPARKTQYQVIHYLAYNLVYNDPNGSTGAQIGTVPAGAVLLTTTLDVNTAFNAGTTNPINVGSTPTGTNYLSGINGGAVASTATPVPIAGRAPLAADTPIYVSYIPTGTAASAGSATVHISYIPSVN